MQRASRSSRGRAGIRLGVKTRRHQPTFSASHTPHLLLNGPNAGPPEDPISARQNRSATDVQIELSRIASGSSQETESAAQPAFASCAADQIPPRDLEAFFLSFLMSSAHSTTGQRPTLCVMQKGWLMVVGAQPVSNLALQCHPAGPFSPPLEQFMHCTNLSQPMIPGMVPSTRPTGNRDHW